MFLLLLFGISSKLVFRSFVCVCVVGIFWVQTLPTSDNSPANHKNVVKLNEPLSCRHVEVSWAT